MVSIPCSSTVPFPTKLPLFNKTLTSTTTTTSSTHHFPFFRSPCHHAFHHRLPAISRPFISNAFSSDQDRDSSGGYQKQMRTLFPGGFKRPEIKVPTVVLRVDAEEILGNEESRAAVDQAVSKLFVEIVLLSCNGGDGGGGGGRFYQAACALKELIRDRAYLVIEDRVDIASAVGASGILLSDQGLPAIIARNMMLKSMPKSVLLPLVARTVQTMDDAASASSSDGTDFLIVGTTSKNYCNELEKFMLFQDIKIPIFLSVIDTGGDYSLLGIASKILESGASGLVLSVDDLKLFGGDMFKLFESVDGLEQRMQNGMPYCNNLEITEVKRASSQKKLVAGFNKLADMEIQFIEAERQALLEAVGIIGKAAPLMKEASLLVDAIARLDQPFLLAIVGEFNSGKSSVINALLGRKFLKEGVVPTTNEITLLCHSDTDSVEQERCERHPDGQFICYVPAPILKEMNIVDTPGTNVILQRQQRLTEEFIPRADLVLFVLSSDRPLTESEVQFLLYVREWKKNVIFALNKSDLYRSTSELEEAIAFIKENVRKLLMTEHVILFPVSARSALEAKLSASSYIEADYNKLLFTDPHWCSSGFSELESFLFSFLDGSTDTGMERMRIKLETPIAIADRLLVASENLVKQEYELACKDLSSINELVSSVKEYAMRMEYESSSWKRQALLLVEAAKTRTIKLIASILQPSNIDLITTYIFRGDKSSSVSVTASIQNDIISPALSDAQKLLGEYLQWLESSATQECNLYSELFEKRGPGFIRVNNQAHSETNGFLQKDKLSLQVTQSFSASAAARLFEQEIREVALVTYGGLGAAGLSASLLTSVLPTTLEDLLALGFCSAGGLLAISNFPARRKRAIDKVNRVADGLAQQIEEAMQEDLAKTTEKLEKFVKHISEPYLEAAQHKIDHLSQIQKEVTEVAQKLRVLKTRIQNLHGS